MIEMAAEPDAFRAPPPPLRSGEPPGGPPPGPAAPTGPPRRRGREEGEGGGEAPRPRNGFRAAGGGGGGGGGGKRRSSCAGPKQPPWKRRRRATSECDPALPSEFLLGGNIFDPLNLNSLLDEEVSRALNARTPQSSPLPARGRDPVEILIPRDITDPLSLNAPGGGDDDGLRLASPAKATRRRHRHRGQQRANNSTSGAASSGAEPESRTEHGNAAGGGTGSTGSTACSNSRHRKRRRTCSKSEPGRPAASPEKGKNGNGGSKSSAATTAAARRRKTQKFQYGNYCKYYGYRNPDCEDGRLKAMKAEWFAGKEVLDVGCNVGHVTLSIAKRWGPSRVVGLDIDGALIRSARQNIRHYLSEEMAAAEGGGRKGFPAALLASRGPIAAPRLPPDGPGAADFPHNVVFVTVRKGAGRGEGAGRREGVESGAGLKGVMGK